ncbi:MAG: NUDIX hydrolase [Nanoarchaeota archaeon]|nr:NUDIX hydrolase [Nanoarchaeota archaeon]MBU4242305.1 NUDIX hydrolase [Nanoarchaeota archaeon]MBU4352773.1 NUDIX hydrolase [Nanoarchaeota archaeon]MBU4456830.1 NUDIX hydrolase [Nanoarchaeota archaeon]MCG2719691.1 NUDIX hydrolase [Nanoarchaeota archaeon]
MEKPSVTVDIILFTITGETLKVLLVKRRIEPFRNMWALPGGFVGMNETLDQAARRELQEETGVKEHYLEQLYTFGNPERDPRGRVITVSYFALINSKDLKLKADTDVIEAKWFPINQLPELAFDHKNILDYALERLRYKLEYTTVAFQLLPQKFTLTELQKTYEIIFNKSLDKRNFRKKILSLGLIEETQETTKGAHRPAKLYSFTKEHKQLENFIKS